jgi:hypothetical protein
MKAIMSYHDHLTAVVKIGNSTISTIFGVLNISGF